MTETIPICVNEPAPVPLRARSCKRCGLDLEPGHGNRKYHAECQTAERADRQAADLEARRAQRASKHDPNCKRCHLDLGPHHGNREYHPECEEALAEEKRQARRALNRIEENKQQRSRYALKRANAPLLTVKCSYRAEGVHAFKTRDLRVAYCSDEHRKLGETILQRAADRAEYAANRQKHLDKNRAAARIRRELAGKGKRLSELKAMPDDWRAIVPILWAHPEWGNSEVLKAAGIEVSKTGLHRMRIFAGVPGLKGRAAKTL